MRERVSWPKGYLISMGQHELNPELAEHVVKPGEVRNPLGISDLGKRRRNYEIRRLLMAEANEPSKIPGYEHLTKMQVGVSTLLDLYQHGVQWAVKEVHNRLFGRVPLDVNATITPQSPTADLDELTDDELTARAEQLLARMRALPASPPADVDAIDGVVVEDHPATDVARRPEEIPGGPEGGEANDA